MDPSPSPINLNVYAFSCTVLCFLAILVGILVFRKDPTSPTYKVWLFQCLSVAGWAFWIALAYFSNEKNIALWCSRVGDFFSLFIPVTYLHFVMRHIGHVQPSILRISYAIACLIGAVFWTPFFVVDVSRKFGVWYEVSGPGMFISAMLFIVLPSYGIYLLMKHLHQTHGVRRSQIKALIIASILGFSTGFMWYLPGFNIDIPPIGGLFISLYCIVLIYAILKYQWMDVQLVIQKSLIYSILVTLLTAGYFGLVYGIERIFQTTLGYQSIWISLGSFAMMALAFQPLKVGIQRLVDWIIFGVPQEEMVKRVERLEQQALLSEKFKATSTLAAGMAHEIKNPLTAIKTFGEFLPERHSDLAFIKQCSEVLKHETNRIHRIVQDVLDFAKPRPPQIEPVDLSPLIQSTVDFLSSELLKRKIQWKVACQHDGQTAQVDPDQLRQVLINLIQNAADAMPDGGKLSISTQPVNGHLELTVSDTGEGIPEKLLPKIFDPFVTTKEDGNGLGLAMVYSILRANHGTIRAENLPGKGSAFTVSLSL